MVLEVSVSGYYAWLTRKESQRSQQNKDLDTKIISVFTNNRGRYGVRRIAQTLHSNGDCYSKNRIGRRMQHLQLKAIARRKWKATTNSKHNLPVAENILNRDWSTTGMGQKWVSDITYIYTREGWLYLAAVMDLYSRAIVGLAFSTTMETALVSEALQQALWRQKFPTKTIVHSDRGSQYCSAEYQQLLRKHQLICSMSRKGNCWDNAPMESFFHTLKTELIDFCIGFETRLQAEKAIKQYIEGYYNQERMHSALAYRTPSMVECNG